MENIEIKEITPLLKEKKSSLLFNIKRLCLHFKIRKIMLSGPLGEEKKKRKKEHLNGGANERNREMGEGEGGEKEKKMKRKTNDYLSCFNFVLSSIDKR